MTFLHLRPAGDIGQQRHQQQQRNSERCEACEPLRPADLHVGDLLGDAQRRGIGRQRGQEQRAGHRGGRKRGPHHIGADSARRGSGLRAVDPRNVADDGIDRAAAARGIGRRRRSQHEVRERHRIAETDRAAAEAAHQHQGEPSAKSALAISDREHESADDQPHRAFGEATQHPSQRFIGIGFDIARDPGNGQADQPDRAHRHGFKDQAGDDGCEQREVVPLIGVETGRSRHQIDREPDGQRRDRPPCDFHECPFWFPKRFASSVPANMRRSIRTTLA